MAQIPQEIFQTSSPQIVWGAGFLYNSGLIPPTAGDDCIDHKTKGAEFEPIGCKIQEVLLPAERLVPSENKRQSSVGEACKGFGSCFRY